MTRRFNDNHPIVLGLYGKALTGKTITAENIVPKGYVPDPSISPIQWDHLYFALPLYRMLTARTKTAGEMANDRALYELHATLLDLFGGSPLYGAPSYFDLVRMVRAIAEIEIPVGGKARGFLQDAGTLCRAYNDDCFVTWMKRRVNELFRLFSVEQEAIVDDYYYRLHSGGEQDLEDPNTFSAFGVVISDVRFANEAKYVAEQPNGVLIGLTATLETRQARSYNRDGHLLAEEHMKHESETAEIPEEYFTEFLPTDDLSVQEQIAAVLSILTNTLQGIPNG